MTLSMLQMAVEEGGTSSASDLILALAHESGECLTVLNAAECMFITFLF